LKSRSRSSEIIFYKDFREKISFIINNPFSRNNFVIIFLKGGLYHINL
jgi:hypothetical protein